MHGAEVCLNPVEELLELPVTMTHEADSHPQEYILRNRRGTRGEKSLLHERSHGGK